jgi:hypothetical protein
MVQHFVEFFMLADADLLDLDQFKTFRQFGLLGFGKLLLGKRKQYVVLFENVLIQQADISFSWPTPSSAIYPSALDCH